MSAIQGNSILQQQFVQQPEPKSDGQVPSQSVANAGNEGEAKPLENRTVEMTKTDPSLTQPPLEQVNQDEPEVEQKSLDEREVSVAAKPVDLDEILAKTLKTVQFGDNVKALLRRTLEQQANNEVVANLVKQPSLDTLSLLCKLATKMPIAENAPREEVLAAAYLKGFSASTTGDVALMPPESANADQKSDASGLKEDDSIPKDDDSIPKTEEPFFDDSDDSIFADTKIVSKKVNLVSNEYTAIPNDSIDLFNEDEVVIQKETVVRGDLELKIREHAGDEKNFAELKRVLDERIDDFAVNVNVFAEDALPAARKVLSLIVLSHLRCSDFYETDKWEADVFGALLQGVFDKMGEDDQAVMDLARRVNLHMAIDEFLEEKGDELDALIADKKAPFKSDLAQLFKEKLNAFLEARSDDLYLDATAGEESEANLLDRLYEEAMEPCELTTRPMPATVRCSAVQGRMMKWDVASPLNIGVQEKDFRNVMVLQTANNCFIDAPLNGILASGGIANVKSVLPQKNGSGDYVFTLGRPIKDVRLVSDDGYKRSFTVSTGDIALAKKKWLAGRNATTQGSKDLFTDLDWALHIAQGRLKDVQRKYDSSIGENPPLGLFNTDREIMNLLGYAEDIETDAGTEKPRQRMIDSSLTPGARLRQVHDVCKWQSEHPDGVLTLNINNNHFVAVTDVYYRGEKDFGFVVRDSNGSGSAGNLVHMVNVCEDSSYTVEFYVPGGESEE